MFGSAGTLDEAKKLKREAGAKGYTTSYIVAYKNGKRVTIAEALK
jgi:N-acetylmuramoyl-L-alanine amidase